MVYQPAHELAEAYGKHALTSHPDGWRVKIGAEIGYVGRHRWPPHSQDAPAIPAARMIEYLTEENTRLAMGLCPASGLPLVADGNAAAISDFSCEMCDCFGYSIYEIGRA